MLRCMKPGSCDQCRSGGVRWVHTLVVSCGYEIDEGGMLRETSQAIQYMIQKMIKFTVLSEFEAGGIYYRTFCRTVRTSSYCSTVVQRAERVTATATPEERWWTLHQKRYLPLFQRLRHSCQGRFPLRFVSACTVCLNCRCHLSGNHFSLLGRLSHPRQISHTVRTTRITDTFAHYCLSSVALWEYPEHNHALSL